MDEETIIENLEQEAFENVEECDDECTCTNCIEKGDTEYYFDKQKFANITIHELKCNKCTALCEFYVKRERTIDNNSVIHYYLIITKSWKDDKEVYKHNGDEWIKEVTK